MTILTANSIKSLRPPKFRFPRWPKIDLSQRLSDAMRADARAIASTYRVALGQEPDASFTRARGHRELDY